MIKEETSEAPKYYDGIEYPRPQQQKSKETVVHIDEPLGSIRILGKCRLKGRTHHFR